MYRVQFDFIDVILAKETSLKTMANFNTLWNQQFINQGNSDCLFLFWHFYDFYVEYQSYSCNYKYIYENDMYT